MALTKDFRVAIVGGGLCGVACAVALSRSGIQVDLFESASKFGEVGAGVGVGPNALRALINLGVLQAVLSGPEAPKPTMRAFQMISTFPGHELIVDHPILEEDKGLGIHRAVFIHSVASLLDSHITHFGKRCNNITQPSETGSSRSVIHFTDGSCFEADVVIGADGIRSAVRGSILEASALTRPVFTNTFAYRALVPTEDIIVAGVKTDLSKRPLCWVGSDKHIITFPIKNGQIINVVVFRTDYSKPVGSTEIPLDEWVMPVSRQELLDAFKDCGSDVTILLSLMNHPSRWAIHQLYPPLECFVRQNIALVGDSAHAMCPHLGAGVGQGFEDCSVICRLLAHPQTTVHNIQDVLLAYSKVRAPRANRVLEKSTWAGRVYESLGKNGTMEADIADSLVGYQDWVWHHDLEVDVEAAVTYLQEKGVFV